MTVQLLANFQHKLTSWNNTAASSHYCRRGFIVFCVAEQLVLLTMAYMGLQAAGQAVSDLLSN